LQRSVLSPSGARQGGADLPNVLTLFTRPIPLAGATLLSLPEAEGVVRAGLQPAGPVRPFQPSPSLHDSGCSCLQPLRQTVLSSSKATERDEVIVDSSVQVTKISLRPAFRIECPPAPCTGEPRASHPVLKGWKTLMVCRSRQSGPMGGCRRAYLPAAEQHKPSFIRSARPRLPLTHALNCSPVLRCEEAPVPPKVEPLD
jgi:hypothetical protein